MTEPRPFFTVVVPTRERADTLRYTLATITAQDYDDLAILVCDNASEDETRTVVEDCRDPRVRYVRTERRLSMSRNWEFALSHVKRGFVTYVGDDDGLMPDALASATSLITAHRCSALVWRKAHYQWPSHPQPWLKNLLTVPLRNRLLWCDSRTVADDCGRFWATYDLLPCVYNAFADIEVMRRVARRTGGFFASITPDVYSGLAIASEIDRYLLMTRPLTINGASGRSQGANADRFFQKDGAVSETARFMQEADLPLHPQMPVLVPGSGVAAVLEALLQARDRCYGGTLTVKRGKGIRWIMREVSTRSRERYTATAEALRQIGQRTNSRRQVEDAIRAYPNRPRDPLRPQLGLGWDDSVTVDAGALGVKDIAGAARCAAAMLGPYLPPTHRRSYRHSLKYISRGIRHVRSRLDSYFWD